MAPGSSSDPLDKKVQMNMGGKNVEPFVPRRGHNPKELRSWAKRTGYVSNLSGESGISNVSGSAGFDLERGVISRGGSSPKIEIDPILGRTRDIKGVGVEIEPDSGYGDGLMQKGSDGTVRGESRKIRVEDEYFLGARGNEKKQTSNETSNGSGREVPTVVESKKKDDGKDEGEVGINVFSDDDDDHSHGGWPRSSETKCGLSDNPGLVPLICYGLQHYLSITGSLIFIPLIIVPAMGGTDKDTATVISTMLFVSGITTILHSYFGTRLPLVQGSSFVYLAPALVIINSHEYRNLTEHKFRHTMRELQGAIVVGSIFQCILGFSGLFSLLLRLISPVVVAPTVAAVGLAFFSYGFPQAGSCVEISIPLILLVLIFTLYLRKISLFGHQIFRIYAVPLSIVIIWAYAFFLTAGGAYNYEGCSSDIPSSNILVDACRKHVYTMKQCRTDVSDAWRTADWVRIPYPLQWGIPSFHLRTSIIMIFVSLVASIDSVGTYHSAALIANLKAPTPGIVSRGIGMEGFCSILAGIWGSGTGSTTLIENVYTIDATKIASRKAVNLGAVFLILCSFIGKIGAILASIPQALAASVLCFVWALIVALGLKHLQHCQTSSFRNSIIVGVSLFLGLSIPAYFQQYQPVTSFILPSYFNSYAAASNGPVQSGNYQVDFAVNALMSINMVVTLLVAFVLDNTVLGSRQERGVYQWSIIEDVATDPNFAANYSLPRKIVRMCGWAKCLC